MFVVLFFLPIVVALDGKTCEAFGNSLMGKSPNIEFHDTANDLRMSFTFEKDKYHIEKINGQKVRTDFWFNGREGRIDLEVGEDFVRIDNLFVKEIKEPKVNKLGSKFLLFMTCVQRNTQSIKMLKLSDASDLRFSFLLKFGITFYERFGFSYVNMLPVKYRELKSMVMDPKVLYENHYESQTEEEKQGDWVQRVNEKQARMISKRNCIGNTSLAVPKLTKRLEDCFGEDAIDTWTFYLIAIKLGMDRDEFGAFFHYKIYGRSTIEPMEYNNNPEIIIEPMEYENNHGNEIYESSNASVAVMMAIFMLFLMI